jgi:CNT family concentrative nucleoside transporter
MMIGGMGTVSGGILAVYVSFGIDPVFLLTTSVMSAPACLLISKMLYPETEVPETAGQMNLVSERIDANIIDATARGAGEGLRLALNVMAVLIAFIALVAMVNAILGWAGGLLGINVARAAVQLANNLRLSLRAARLRDGRAVG